MNEELMAAIDKWYHLINQPNFPLNRKALLIALAKNESSFGKNIGPRYEKAYDKGGYYFQKSPLLRMQHAKYGQDVAKSYGPFQIMYIVALELGYEFNDPPAGLADFDTNTYFAVQYINRRALRKAVGISDIFDSYNSGSCKDGNIPHAYIEKGLQRYEDAASEYPEE